MESIVSLDKKKKEKIINGINGTMESFEVYLNNKMNENQHKIMLFSEELYKSLSDLKLNKGFDVKFQDVIDGEFIVGFRYIDIIANHVIIVGGYGTGYEIYDIDNVYYHLSDEEIKNASQQENISEREILLKKIIKEFLKNYAIAKIIKIDKNYEVF